MSARVVLHGTELWREGIDAPKTQPYKRKKFLGWVDYRSTPHPPLWPTAGWWAGAGTTCHVTGLETRDEAVAALLDAHGIDVAEYQAGAR